MTPCIFPAPRAAATLLLGLGVSFCAEANAQHDWREVARAPNAITQPAIAYDVGRARLVGIFGFETWERSGGIWALRRSNTRPSFPIASAIAHDVARRVTVVVGAGQAGLETWEWDGVDWKQRNPKSSPQNRSFSAMVYDVHRRRTVLYGGTPGGGETWEWDGADWVQRRTANSPPDLRMHGMAYDVARKRVVLFGGWNGSAQGQTWEFDGTDWIQRTPVKSPSPRWVPSMAYDVRRGRTLLFGGWDGSTLLRDTWEWDGKTWTQRNPTTIPESTISARSMAYDVARDQSYLIVHDKAWVWDGSDWSPRALSASPHGAGREGHSLVHDSKRERTVLFGGGPSLSSPAIPFDETWEWDGARWIRMATPLSPAARIDHSMVFDSRRQHSLLFGGMNGSNQLLRDTWLWDGKNWRDAKPATSPPGRQNAALAFDATRGRAVLFGGLQGSAMLNDTWEWDGLTWTKMTPTTSPPARSGHAMAYDAVRRRVVLFGAGTITGGLRGDTWEWDGRNWRELKPSNSPGPRARHGMCFDPKRGRVVLYGGFKLFAPYFPIGLVDTWEWDGTNWTIVTTASHPTPARDCPIACNPKNGRYLWIGSVLGSLQTWEFGALGRARTNRYGVACAGSFGFPEIRARGVPRVGDSFVGVEGHSLAPGSLTLLLTAAQRANIALGSGCTLLVSAPPITSSALANADGEVFFPRPIPNDVRLRGAQLFDQLVAVEPGSGAWRQLLNFSGGLQSVID